MPKLPTYTDLGPTEAPSQRPTGSYDVSPLARAGEAMASGARALGQGIANIGQDIHEVQQKVAESKAFDANAGTASELLDFHSKLQQSKDYANLPQQYQEGAKAIVDKWAQTVPDGFLREHYLASSGEAVARGAAAVSQMSFVGQGQTDADGRKLAVADIESKIGQDPTNSFLPDAIRGLGLRVDKAVGAGWITKEQGDLEKRDAAVKVAIRTNEFEQEQDPIAWQIKHGYLPRQTKALWAAVDQAAKNNGLSPEAAAKVIQIESGGNPNAKTGSYYGLTQISQSEFSKYNRIPGASILDPQANLEAGFAKMKAEGDQFAGKTGHQPSDFDRYMIHQQGMAGYEAHLANPDAPAWQNMLSTGEGKQKGERWAKAAIWGNIPDQYKRQFGGVDNVSSADFLKMWSARYGAPAPTFAEQTVGVNAGRPAGQEEDHSGFDSLDEIAKLKLLGRSRTLAQQRLNDAMQLRNATVNDRYQEHERSMIDANAGIGALPPRELLEKDPDLDDAHRNRLLSLHDSAEAHAGAPEPIARVSQATTMDFVDRMRKPEGDPRKLTDRNEITDAFVKRQMSQEAYTWTLKQFDDARGGGDGASYAKARTDFVKRVVEPQIMKSDISTGLNNTRVGQRAYEFEQSMDRKKAVMLKEGKNPLDMFDPTKPDYMGKKEVLEPLRRTAQRDMADMLAEEAGQAGSGAPPAAPIPADPKAASDLGQLQAMVRAHPALRETAIGIAKERGWIAAKAKAPQLPEVPRGE